MPPASSLGVSSPGLGNPQPWSLVLFLPRHDHWQLPACPRPLRTHLSAQGSQHSCLLASAVSSRCPRPRRTPPPKHSMPFCVYPQLPSLTFLKPRERVRPCVLTQPAPCQEAGRAPESPGGPMREPGSACPRIRPPLRRQSCYLCKARPPCPWPHCNPAPCSAGRGENRTETDAGPSSEEQPLLSHPRIGLPECAFNDSFSWGYRPCKGTPQTRNSG